MRNKTLANCIRVRATRRMVRRSESHFKINDRAYPIRVKFAVPPGGMRTLEIGITVHDWLQRELDHLAWAWGPAHSIAGRATAYYFRSLDDAQRFVEAFPQLELADGVKSSLYTAPGKSDGPEAIVRRDQDRS